MTTAKPHQTAGQSDSADDLIAELAKLMAQDAQTDRPAPAARPVPPATAPQPSAAAPAAAPSIRIPGVASEPQVSITPSGSHFDFGRMPEPQPQRQPPVAARQEPASPPPTPVVPRQEPQAPRQEAVTPRQEPSFTPAPPPRAEEQPAPFNFDFNLPSGQRNPQPDPKPVETQPAPAPQPVTPAPDEHDAIADLIAAELNTPPAPQPVAPPTVQTGGWAATPIPAAPTSQPEPARHTLRPVNLTPVAKPEEDKFRVAPVFGLGTTPPAPQPTGISPSVPVPQPKAPEPKPAEAFVAPVAPTPVPAPDAGEPSGLDPIDEIESLIGRAMRVELDGPSERATPAPAPRSLATPTIPQPAPRPATDRSFSGADEAILAAAAATGAQVGWVDPADAPDAEPTIQRRGRKERKQRDPREPRAPGFARAFVGPLVAVVLLLIAGFGLYWVLGLGRTDGPAPVLTADTAPVKEVPAAQPSPNAAQQSVVFNEMEGVVPGAEEQLVSRDQADVNEVTRVVTPSATEEGLANRKVRTVTVRPDGTIVSGDNALAGSAILPVDRPNVPAVPGAATASPELLANAAAPATPSTQAPAVPEPAVTTPPVVPVVPGSSVPVVDASGNPVAGKIAPVPFQRPASVGNAPPTGPTSPVNAVINDPVGALIEPAANAAQSAVAAATPAAAPAAPAAPQPRTLIDLLQGNQQQAPAQQAATSSGSNAPAYVQLSSQRSEQDARTTASQLTSRFGSLFGGASPEIQRVDLGERGIYYRVRVPAASLQSAAEICSSVKANGGDCFTM